MKKNIIKFDDYKINENNDNEKLSNIIDRLKSPEVVYMELKVSQFRCGDCYFIIDNSYCQNKKIKSKVNFYKGCCNLYIPKKRDEVDSEYWSIK